MDGTIKKEGLRKRVRLLEEKVKQMQEREKYQSSHKPNLTPLNLSVNREIYNLREKIEDIDRRTMNCMQIHEFVQVKRESNLAVIFCGIMLLINLIFYFM